MHIKVPQGRGDLDEASLSLGGASVDSEDPKHFAGVNIIHITDVWEAEGVLENGGLHPEEADLKAPIFLDRKDLPHKVDQLL